MARPITWFETNLGADWTPLADELSLLQHLATDSGRVTLELLGQSYGSRNIYRVGIGLTPPTTAAAKASGQAVLYVGGQHGDEPAGREACLTLARDLAYDTDQATLDLLTTHTVWIIPTLNPDGRANNRRYNDGDFDPNRDHLTIANEGAFVQATISDIDPVFVLDAHEMLGAVTDELRLQTCLTPTADASLLAASNIMLDDLLAHAVGQGIVANPWPGAESPTSFWRDAANPAMLHNAAGLRQMFGLLTETRGAPGDTPQARHDRQMAVFRRVMNHFGEMRAEINAAKAHSTTAVQSPVDLNNGYIINPAPGGYVLDGAAQTVAAAQIAEFGIVVTDDRASMLQAALPLLSVLFDPQSDHVIVVGERYFSSTGRYVSTGGQWTPATGRLVTASGWS